MPSKEDIDWIEGRVGFEFSAEVRDFFTSGESFDKKLFRIGQSGESQIRETLSVEGKNGSTLFSVWNAIRDDGFSAGRIPIAFDIGDNLLMASRTGTVIWVDHESLEEIRIANTLSNFLKKLYDEIPRDLEQIERLAKFGSVDDIETFLSRFPDARSSEGRNFAQESARFGNVDALQICSERGMSFKGCIHLAAMNDQAAAVKFLVDETGVDVNEKNERGWTPLQCVMFDDDLKNWLLDRGAV